MIEDLFNPTNEVEHRHSDAQLRAERAQGTPASNGENTDICLVCGQPGRAGEDAKGVFFRHLPRRYPVRVSPARQYMLSTPGRNFKCRAGVQQSTDAAAQALRELMAAIKP